MEKWEIEERRNKERTDRKHRQRAFQSKSPLLKHGALIGLEFDFR